MTKMKKSGVKWIGEIPISWEKIKIKNVCKKVYAGGTPSTDVTEFWDGNIPWIPSGACHNNMIYNTDTFITEKGLKNSSTKYIPSKTTIIAMTGATCGNVGYLEFDTCANQSVTAYVEEKRKLYSLYLFYVLQAAKEYILTFQTGGAQAGINVENCKNFVIPITKLEEQKRIADLLKVKIKEIDSILEKLNIEIEILDKYKQSLITETVTKGLNPNIGMKESNIDWIGSIPKNWNCKKIKYIITNDKNGIKVGPFGSSLTDAVVGKDEGEYKIYGQANLIRKDFNFGDNFVIEKDYKRLINYEVLPNDIAVSMMGTIGKCCVVPKNIKKGIMDSHLIKIRLQNNIVPKYFEYQYESRAIYEQLMYFSNGAIMNGLNSTIVKNIYLVIPNKKEQQEIVDYLDKKCGEINILLRDKQAQIEKMEQYKKSLIYEYVTGKKRVKGAEELYG